MLAIAAPRAAASAARGARLRVGRGQVVRVPWRLVADGAYTDRALPVYCKVAALAARREGCTAAVETIAVFLGMPKSSVEKSLRQLIRPWGVEQLVEVPTRRRTHPGGQGDTAHRTVRPLGEGELYVWLPVSAAEALPPRLLRLYAGITYAVARRLPTTHAELAGLVGVGVRRVADLVAELERLGWISVHRRAGQQGRHVYEAHRHPLHAVPEPAAPVGPEQLLLPFDSAEPDRDANPLAAAGATPAISGGSGGDQPGGSLATEEDLELTDLRNPPSAVLPSRRRRRPAVARGPVDVSRLAAWTSGDGHQEQQQDQAGAASRRAVAERGRRRQGTAGRPARRAPYTGPELSLSPRIWHVLEPVRDLLPAISPFMLRKAARAIGAELGRGTDPDRVARIRRRIESRRARLDSGRPHDLGAWLLHAALPGWGCGLAACEDGWLWRPWAPGPPVECDVCAEEAARRRLARLQHRRLAAGLCPHHGTPPTRSGACPGCEVDRATGRSIPELLPAPEPHTRAS